MQIPYTHVENIKLNQHAKNATRKLAARHPAMLVLVPEGTRKTLWKSLPYGELLSERLRLARRRAGATSTLSTDAPDSAGPRLLLQCIEPDITPHAALTLARKLAQQVRSANYPGVLLQVAGFDQDTGGKLVNAVVAALLAASCPLPDFRTKPDRPAALKQIDIYGLEQTVDLAPLQAEIAGNHLARWLSVMPGNRLTPGHYRELVAEIAAAEGWHMTFLDHRALQKKNAGAFLAVCQGSPQHDAGIVRLRYRPGKRSERARLALVGKGICFDTGGVNIKPAKYMNGMHEDMQGSAVALGTLLALTRTGCDYPVDCWLALAENHVGNRAYKPNDIITASNGTTIEVKHTDAEGRMVLADTLALASAEKPDTVIDYATLTGACIYSLSSRYSGVFSNRDDLHPLLIAAGRSSGERVWPFPNDDDYDEALKSTVADTLQCTLEGEADHILAARFLQRFVDSGVRWVHVDLSASSHKGGLGHIATDTTGFGVRFTLNLLHEQGLAENICN